MAMAASFPLLNISPYTRSFKYISSLIDKYIFDPYAFNISSVTVTKSSIFPLSSAITAVIILVVLAISRLSSIPFLYKILPVSSSINIALLLLTSKACILNGIKSINNSIIFFI